MVYRGPSRGCANCRRRRRKCDNAEPACTMCVRTNTRCVKFNHALDIVLRDESAKVSDHDGKQHALQFSRQSKPGIGIPRQSPDLSSLTASYWFLSTATGARDLESCHGYLEFLQPMFLKSSSTSPVVHATTAVAVFLQEAWSDLYPDSPRSRKYLGKALKSVNQALSDPEESLKDETLVAVLLLDLHDSFSNMLQTKLPSEAHFDGVIALIDHRGHRNYETEISRRLVNAVRHQVLNYAISKGFTVDKATRIWTEDSDFTANLPRNKATDLDLLCLRLNSLQIDMQSQIAKGSSARPGSLSARLYDLFKDVKALDRDFQVWYDTIPNYWRPVQIDADMNFDAYGKSCDVYFDLGVVKIINEYRLSRATVLTWLIQLTSMGGGFWYEQGLQAKSAFQNIIDEFCDSVPFYIGNKFTAEQFDHPGIFYPSVPGDPERNWNNAIQATALGGTILLGCLRGILDLITPCPVSDPPLLRPGQREWIKRQMLRIAVMYRFRLNPDRFSGAIPPLVSEYVTPEAERRPEVEMVGVGWNFRL